MSLAKIERDIKRKIGKIQDPQGYYGPSLGEAVDNKRRESRIKQKKINSAFRQHEKAIRSDKGWDAKITSSGGLKSVKRADTPQARAAAAQKEMRGARKDEKALRERLEKIEKAKIEQTEWARKQRAKKIQQKAKEGVV